MQCKIIIFYITIKTIKTMQNLNSNPTTNSNFNPGKTEGQYPIPYPQDFTYYNLGDVSIDPTGKSYQVIELDEPDNEGRDIIYHIPDRYALYELINDICHSISKEIEAYQKCHYTPGDDASSDIENAIDMLQELSQFDHC